MTVLKRLPRAVKKALNNQNIYLGTLLLWVIWGFVWSAKSDNVKVLLTGGVICILVWSLLMVGVHIPSDHPYRKEDDEA